MTNVHSRTEYARVWPPDSREPTMVRLYLSTVLLAEAGLTLDGATEACTRAVRALHPGVRVEVACHDTRGWQGVCHHAYDTGRYWRVDEPVGAALRRVLEPARRLTVS